MLLELIAAVAAGFGAAGIAMLLRRASGGRLPKWLVPAAAGAAMIGYATWSDYAWRDQMADALPTGTAVVSEHAEGAWWKPWTLVWPPVVRMSAVNVAGARTHEDAPGMKLTQVLLLSRGAPAHILPVLADCDGWRRADIADSPLGADGMPVEPTWIDADRDDPLLRALCADG